MASQTGKFSLGIELEFLVAYVSESERDILAQHAGDFAETWGKAIAIPDDELNQEDDSSDSSLDCVAVAHCYVFKLIQNTLDSLALPLGEDTTRVFTKPNAEYTSWKVHADCSIDLPGGRPLHERYRGVRWVAVEVISPALWFTRQRGGGGSSSGLLLDDEIRLVCDTLQERYWTTFSESCAVHFHVGRGRHWMPLGALRRTAALLLAADPLLAQLQPAHRVTSEFCLGNRAFSRLAQGLTAEAAKGGLVAAENSSGRVDSVLPPDAHESELLGAILLGEDELTSVVSNFPRKFDRVIPWGALKGYPRLTPGETPIMPRVPSLLLVPPQGIIHCVNELLSASRRGVIATLMMGERVSKRLAYNFNNFREARVGEEQHKRTIEFRQCAGTLDADEIITFAQLFVGLCEFASSAPFGIIWSAIYRCAVADVAVGEPNFDVFDLLTHIGLVREAEVLQMVVMARPDWVAP